MFFRNYGHRVPCLGKCLKSPASEQRSRVNTSEICTAAPLSFFLIALKERELENVSFIDV